MFRETLPLLAAAPCGPRTGRQIFNGDVNSAGRCQSPYECTDISCVSNKTSNPVVSTAKHPTLLQIADRQDEIDYWHAMDTGGRHLVGVVAVWAWSFTFTLFLAYMLSGMILAVPAAVLSAIVATFMGWVWYTDPPLDKPCPTPLVLAPFTGRENDRLFHAQEPEPFRAFCACAGCGDVACHLMREPRVGEPSWAVVIRSCATCQREWAQQ